MSPVAIRGTLQEQDLVSPWLSIRHQFKSNEHFSEEVVFIFYAKRFRITWPSLEISMDWSGTHKIVEFPNHFAIFTSRNCFHSIPRRFFSNLELEEFH